MELEMGENVLHHVMKYGMKQYNINLKFIFFERYQTDETGFQSRPDRYGIYLQFAGQVEVTTSYHSFTAITLVTRIGGIWLLRSSYSH